MRTTFLAFGLLVSMNCFAGDAVLGDAVVVNFDSSTQSSALTAPAGSPGIQKYRLASTTAIHYVVGADPTAASTGVFLPANVVDYVLIPSGHKIAAVKVSGGNAGILSINKVK